MNSKILFPVFLIFSSCYTSSVNTCDKFEKLLASNNSPIDTAKLLSICTVVLKNESSCIDALLTRGDLFLSLNNLDSARADYLRVLAISSSNIYALYHMGILNEIKQNYDSAAYYFKFALLQKEKNGAFIDYSSKLKGVESTKSKYDISTIELIYQYGLVSYYLRDMSTALRNFELCISENYKSSQVYLYRGAVLLETGNKEGSCKDFNNSLELGNKDAKNYLEKYCK